MKLEGEYELEAGVQEVWDALFDPAVLAAAMPGCDKLELVDGVYLGELKVKVGPVQGKFSGKVDLLDKVEPKSYRMVIDGRGAQGFVKANATIELAVVSEGKTRLRYQSEAQIGGKIATVGHRLVEASAKAIAKQSLEGLNENVKIRAEAYRQRAKVSEAAAEPATAEAEATPAAAPASAAEATPAAAPASAEATPAAPPAPSSEPVAAGAPAPGAEVAGATSAAGDVASASSGAATEPPADGARSTDARPAEPDIQYKRADAGKMATAVAKEVGKTVAPTLIGALVAIALLAYLLLR